jgi:cell division protein FtsW
MKPFSRTDQSIVSRWWWTVDRGMLAVLLAIIVIGVFLVMAASPPVAMRIGLPQFHFVTRHLIVLAPAVAIMLSVSLLSLKNLRRLCFVTFGITIVLMMLVLVIGQEIKGAQRWIHLPGFSLQPSEIIKPVFIVMAAWFVARAKDHPGFPGIKIAIALYALVAGLLLLQPDMGMTFVVTSCFMVVIFLAGVPLRYVVLLGVLGAGGAVAAYYGFDHVKSRVDRFLDPASGDTYQIDKSLAAFQNGGLLGTGPGQGEVKNAIPDAHADFIFSVAGEELGVVFIVILIALYAYVVLRGLNRIMDSEDMFVVLGTGGLLSMFGLQALVHMGSALSLLPTKGMTLPFISYGGSSLLGVSLAMGMVLALTRRQAKSGIARGGLSIRPIGG